MKRAIFFAGFAAIALHAAPNLYTVGKEGYAREISAVVYSKNESAISSKISGYIKRIYVEEGDSVKKGSPLFEIDTSGIEASAIGAQSAYLSAKALSEDAKKDFERYKNLFEKGVVSEKELERAKLNYELKEQSAISAKAFASHAKNERAYAKVLAPIDGIVLKRYLSTASLVMPGQPVILLSGKGDLQIRADIYESELELVQVGSEVSFKTPKGVQKAKVVSISPNGANSRNFLLRAVPLNSDSLYSGSFVKLALPLSTGGVKIPLNCITKRAGVVGVFEYNSGIAKFRALKIKRKIGESAIVEGIGIGAKLIQNPKDSLQDGQKAE